MNRLEHFFADHDGRVIDEDNAQEHTLGTPVAIRRETQVADLTLHLAGHNLVSPTRLSVIIPVYNERHTLGAILKVVAQTCQTSKRKSLLSTTVRGMARANGCRTIFRTDHAMDHQLTSTAGAISSLPKNQNRLLSLSVRSTISKIAVRVVHSKLDLLPPRERF